MQGISYIISTDTMISDNVTALIDLAIKEDTPDGDITSTLLIPKDKKSTATIIARESFIFCGGHLIELIIDRFHFSIIVTNIVPDGRVVKDGDILAKLEGTTHEILTVERTILNFLQRLSGVATNTSNFVKEAHGVHILDTRKTTPGWRELEKYAVRVGGAENHRMHLGDLVLIKNNHIDAQKGDWNAIKQSLEKKPLHIPVEAEVRTVSELSAMLAYLNPDIIMLDNMKDDEVQSAVKLIRGQSAQSKIEVSGGITTSRLQFLSTLGEIYVSIGALTTKATNVDISLRMHGGN